MLEVRGLEVHYGGICAVRGVDLDVAAGEKVALIGANGAGKTSTLKAIARMLPARGSVKLGGEPIEHAPPHLLVRKGLALVPEGRGVFARLSVLENLEMGAYVRDDKAAIEAAALNNEDVQKHVAGQTPKKVIVVPGRLVNIVV